MTYEVNRVANMSKSAKEIYEASLGISNAIVHENKKSEYKNKDQDGSLQSIKVEQISVDVDPLLLHEIKEKTFEENEATQIQDSTAVYIKQEEFGASDQLNEQEKEMIVQEIKKGFIYFKQFSILIAHTGYLISN